MADITAEKFNELKIKVFQDTATSDEMEAYLAYMQAKKEETKKAETSAKAIIDSIKKAKIAPQILTNLLANEGLIVLPKIEEKEEKVIVFEKDVTTPKDRASKFKVWAYRPLNLLTGDAKGYWEPIKKEGKDAFVKALNEAGQKLYKEDEKFKKWIDEVFK